MNTSYYDATGWRFRLYRVRSLRVRLQLQIGMLRLAGGAR